MAIKGKSRSRGAKAVTRGPKPVYVPVKTPLLRRRGFWIGVATIVGLAAIAGVWYGIAKQLSDDRARELQERLTAAMTEYRRLVEPILQPVGQPLPPTAFQPFPDLSSTLDRIEAGRRLDETADAVDAITDSATGASEALAEVDANQIIADRGFDQLFIVYVLDSREGMTRGLQLYAQAASLASLAVGTEGADRDDLVAAAREAFDTATVVFASGYSDYVEAQSIAGVFQPALGVP